MSRWSSYFNRPLKDPLLLSYTVEELAYEYFNTIERKKAETETVEKEGDKIEEEKRLEAEKWADSMEEEEESEQPVDKSQEEKQWMEKVLEENKQEFGESFGEDLSLDF